jgi:hypothetical protein
MNISSPTSPLKQRRSKGKGNKNRLVFFLLLSLICGVAYILNRKLLNRPTSAPVRDLLLHIDGFQPQDLSLALAAALQGRGDETRLPAGSSGYGNPQTAIVSFNSWTFPFAHIRTGQDFCASIERKDSICPDVSSSFSQSIS